jgi:hypothetical protein
MGRIEKALLSFRFTLNFGHPRRALAADIGDVSVALNDCGLHYREDGAYREKNKRALCTSQEGLSQGSSMFTSLMKPALNFPST